MAAKKKASFDQMPAKVQSLILDDSNAIDQETLLKEIISGFGGAKEIANTMVKEFKDAAPGGITRQRIMELITRLVVNVSESNSMLVKRASDMTDQELKDVAVRMFAQALEAKDAKGKTPEGTGAREQEAAADPQPGSHAGADSGA